MPADYTKKYTFRSIKVVVCASKSADNSIVLRMMHDTGFVQCMMVHDVEELRTVFHNEEIDLFIYDQALARDALNTLVRTIRRGELRVDPFLTVITLLSDPTKEAAMACINSGVDAIILRPFSQSQFLDHLWHVIEHRKPFVVTNDYIGPDRRKAPRPGTQQIPTISVPNVLLDKLMHTFNAAKVARHTTRAMAEIKEQQMVRHAYQIDWLANKAIPLYAQTPIDASLPGLIDVLVRTAHEMNLHLFGIEDPRVGELCVSIKALADRLHITPDTPDPSDLEDWPKIAQELKSVERWYAPVDGSATA